MKHALPTAVAAALLLVTGIARADGASDVEEILDRQIVVGASKSSETEVAAPATVTVLTSEDFRRYGIYTIQDAVDFLSLGAVSSPSPGGTEIGARGVLVTGDSDLILLLVNGHTLNDPLTGGVNIDRAAGIPMELVDHIEVILGPGSVLYGTGAMLGVINVVTKRANAFAGTHVVAEATPFSAARLMAGGGYELSLFGARSEVTAAVEYFAQDGPSLSFPKQTYSGFGPPGYAPTGTWGGTASRSNTAQVPSAMLRLISGNLEINVRGVIDRVGIPTSLYKFDDPLNRQVERGASVDVAYRVPVSAVVELSARGYADTYERQIHQVSGTFGDCLSGGCDFVDAGAARWAGLETRASFDWLRSGKLVTVLGVDARVRYVHGEHDTLDSTTGMPLEAASGRFETVDLPVGVYAQQSWHATRWLAFNGGLRMDNDARFAPFLSPRLVATISPWPAGTLKGIYSEAFRAPSFEETNSSSPLQLQSVGLEAERVRMYEVSFEQGFGAQRVRFGGFAYEWEDLIELHTFSDQELRAAVASGALGDIPYSRNLAVTQTQNIESLTNWGFNLGYDGSVDGGALRYAANVTASHTRSADGTSLPVGPQIFGNARVSYALPGQLPTLAIAGRFQGWRAADRAFSGAFVPTPYVPPMVELRGTISGAVPGVRGLSYRAMADYALRSLEPYVIGPQQSGTPGHPSADLYQRPAFTSVLGLQYDF
jgi:outer membrane receptor for ferrienterochelin and colicins